MIRVRVTHNLANLQKLKRLAQPDSRHPAVDRFFNRAAVRYLGFSRDRFVKFSRGGGDWPPLKASTIAARRAGKGKGTLGGQRQKAMKRLRNAKTEAGAARARKTLKRIGIARGKVAILRDTGMLFKAMAAGGPGNHIERDRTGINVGIEAGPQHTNGPMTIGRLAAIHNFGMGRVPKRVIFTPEVDAKTIRGNERDLAEMVRRIGATL